VDMHSGATHVASFLDQGAPPERASTQFGVQARAAPCATGMLERAGIESTSRPDYVAKFTARFARITHLCRGAPIPSALCGRARAHKLHASTGLAADLDQRNCRNSSDVRGRGGSRIA